jgi:hypothetical protein
LKTKIERSRRNFPSARLYVASQHRFVASDASFAHRKKTSIRQGKIRWNVSLEPSQNFMIFVLGVGSNFCSLSEPTPTLLVYDHQLFDILITSQPYIQSWLDSNKNIGFFLFLWYFFRVYSSSKISPPNKPIKKRS